MTSMLGSEMYSPSPSRRPSWDETDVLRFLNALETPEKVINWIPQAGTSFEALSKPPFYLSKHAALRPLPSLQSPDSSRPDKNVAKAEATAANSTTDALPDDKAFGLTTFVEGVNPVVDIIAIHGLNGHREKAWTAKNNVNWLRDPNMLPAAIPNARIMSWGYDANTHSTNKLSAMYLYDHANDLVSDLSRHRRLDKALIHSDSARSGHLHHHRSIKTSTYGIMFMGTPHQGESVALGKILVGIASIFVNTNDRLLNTLAKDSEALQQQLGQYTPINGDFETKFAFETKATPLFLGSSTIVVPKACAVVPGQVNAEAIAIMGNHIDMVKFSSKNEEFETVAGHLKLMAEEAPAKIQANWLTESDVAAARDKKQKSNFDVAFDLTKIPKTSAFIGRKSDLNLIKKHLMPGETSDRRNICVLHGLGGIGKTQLAIEYARLQKALYTSFFWLDGNTEDSLIQSLLIIMRRLPKGQIRDVKIEDIKGSDESKMIAQEVLEWFALDGNNGWLLIFDNIDKTSYEEESSSHDSNSSSYDITQYFPPGDTGSIIVTTRLQRLASLGESIHLCKLNTLDSLFILEKNARRALKRSPSADGSEIGHWDPDAVSLVERLGYLPLALVFAGSYISKVDIPKYVKLYDKSWAQLHSKMIRSDYPERTIITTWQISFDEIQVRNKEAAKLLQLWGYLDRQELWFELVQWRDFESGAPDWLQKITVSEVSFFAMIDALLDYSLIERNDNCNTFSVHAVVHDWIQASVNRKADKELLHTAVTTIGLAARVVNMRDSAALQRRIFQHAVHCSQYWGAVDFEQSVDTMYLWSLNSIGNLYLEQGRLAEAEHIYKWALEGRDVALGPEHPSTLEVVNNLGIIYSQQGRLDDAEQMCKRALMGTEAALGPDDLATLNVVNNLGNIYSKQSKLAEAEHMYKRALEGRDVALGPEHPSTLEVVNNLGAVYSQQGRFAEAEQMYKRALGSNSKETALRPEHLSTLEVVNNLGNLYLEQGRLAEAEHLFQLSLEGIEAALGPKHPSTLQTVNNLGILYQKQSRFAEAEPMYKRALEGRQAALRPGHPSTINTAHNLSILYLQQGRLAEAGQMYNQAGPGSIT
ncbi:Uncharacterized protein BP5553_06053 [Venustampulla echinocandica]|uniref:Uncharacterized protein n=1 Tax=Venustampulla echinocandica TaxID=2656787 RepID=A0A370TMF7_9HELO|nr:Uncharacterized protein BP5553_06053 [Venustampulla echinocandica]RDL36701.1 Uncharacterized protein BP5553_06053 [Venustampulla echinocandica]